MSRRNLFAILLFSAMLGCMARIPVESPRPAGDYVFQETTLSSLTDDGDGESLERATDKTLEFLTRKSSGGKSSGTIHLSAPPFTAERVARSVALFKEIVARASAPSEWERRIAENFTVWEIRSGGVAAPVLLTGYYEPLLEARLEPGGEFQHPLYRRPDDLIEEFSDGPSGERKKTVIRMEGGKTGPYYSRREIDREGALRGKNLEIAWVRDRWDVFVLHVQGSGQLRLPDGKVLRVGFAASNGRPYRSIGRVLIEQGYLTEREVSLERVREFLRRNPGLAEEIYCLNERYVFFRTVSGPEGPLGALGVPLTPGRSVATDLSLFPRGALGYLVSRQPVLDESGKIVGWKPLRRFVLNQDTGAAMKGPSRVDLFFGSGDQAGTAAGQMREEGRIYLLLAK